MKAFSPTTEQIRLAEDLLVSMAHESLIRPVVEAYEQAILDAHEFQVAPEWREYGVADNVVRSRKQTFLLSQEDAKVFFAKCHAARDAAGLKVVAPDNCPLLEAENQRIKAENALIQSIARIPTLEPLGRAALTLTERKRVVDLALGLLAPFCGDADDILQRMLAA